MKKLFPHIGLLRDRLFLKVFCSWNNVRFYSKSNAAKSTQPLTMPPPRAFRSMSTEASFEKKNRLASEKSPYLLQHSTNPVSWYPWGQEAFDKAKAEDKMIFLSVGYSTCHWCHVMERESFESDEIGHILNENFVSIKVDREERPDVDKVYMTFIQATSGGGGWPMSVWLTPDLNPIVGGTYFPPDDRYFGRPGFKSILLNLAKQWKTKREIMEDQGAAILEALKSGTHSAEKEGEGIPGLESTNTCYNMLEKSYDEEFGGFGKAPKFPQPVNFSFMCRYYASNHDNEQGKRALDMCLNTLKCMANGGIYDHVSQGFHRYSTDKFWHVPHFEKMLYDQGQLLFTYSEAYQITKDERFADIARNIVKYVTRDLSSPAGGFYSAEDADSLPIEGATEKREGAFCVWTQGQVNSILKNEVEVASGRVKMADVFSHHYGIEEDGNVDPYQDPHDELKDQNVLIVRGSLSNTAKKFDLTDLETSSMLEKCLELLYDVRQCRPRPHLDDKMIASWNGLMISGLAKAGQVLGEASYVKRAEQAAQFLREFMYIAEENTLLRTSYTNSDKSTVLGPVQIKGFVDDYAFVIRGLLDLYEASLSDRWLEWAENLQEQQNKAFWDEEGGGYYNSTDNDKSIVLRLKDDQDGAEPCPNSVSVHNLLRMSNLLHRSDYHNKAVRILRVFYERLTKIPVALPEMTSAVFSIQTSPKQIVLVGDSGAEDLQSMIKCVNSHFSPNKVVIVVDGENDTFIRSKLEFLDTLQKIDGKATAYVCENYSCSLPVNSVEELKAKL